MAKDNNYSNREPRAAVMPADSRPMPKAENIEAAVLGAAMLDDTCADLATEIVQRREIFHNPAHAEIFDCVFKLRQQDKDNGVDMLTVSEELSRRKKLEAIGGDAYLAQLTESIVSHKNIEQWCRTIVDYAKLRDMIRTCHEALDKCHGLEAENVSAVLDEVESAVFKVREEEQSAGIFTTDAVVTNAFKYLNDVFHKNIDPGIKTGFPDLDTKTTGLKPGEMVVVAARPSIGKTALALNMVRQIAEQYPVAFFSLEMTADQIGRRLICTEAKITQDDVIQHKISIVQLTQFTQAVAALKPVKLFIDETPALRISQLRSKARRLKAKEDIKLIAIDYLQLMKSDANYSDNRQQEVADISHGIKSLAKELNIPILVLAQLNREIEKGSGKPKLSHLRESGAIEQDADVVMFLHRDRDAQKDASEEAQKVGIEAELIIEKNRNGETGFVKLLFFPKRMLFSCATRYNENDRPPKINA